MPKLKVNLTKYKEAQDMIRLIQKNKNLSVVDAIDYSINQKICDRILDTGWGSIALPIWGHDDYDRKRLTLDNPYIEMEVDEEKYQLIKTVSTREGVNIETSISYFLLFTMESLGYHI